MKIPGIPDFDFDLSTFAGGEIPVWNPGTKTFVGMTIAQALTFTPESIAHKDQASGYAGLSVAGKLAASQLPTLPSRQAITLGASTGVIGGVWLVDTTSAQTDVATTEKTLWTVNVPAGTLDANFKALRVKAFGNFGANANNKTIRLYLSAFAIVQGGVTSNNEGWAMEMDIIRIDASANPSCVIHRRGYAGSSLIRPTVSTVQIDWTAQQTLSMTGQNGTASAGDVVFKGAIVEVLN